MEDGGSDAVLCLVSRGLSLFLTVDASKAPKKQQNDFIALAVRRAAPFPDPEFDVRWSPDGMAAIWYWSASRVRSQLKEHTRRRQKFVAEGFYLGTPQEDAVELFQLTEGFEGRIWKGGNLQVSRWWPDNPTAEQWQTFFRGVGQPLTPGLAAPSATVMPLASVPWNTRALGTDSLKLAGVERYLPNTILAISMAVLTVCGWQLGSIGRAQIDIWRAADAASSLDAPLQRILDARGSADRAVQEIDALLALRGPVRMTSLMAEFVQLMPGTNWKMKHWNQPTPDTLELVVSAPDTNPEQLLSLLEASPMLSGVTSDLDRNGEMKIRARIEAPKSAGASP